MDTPADPENGPPKPPVVSAFVSQSTGKSSSEIASFMQQATSDMEAHYNRIHERAAEDPGTAGDTGECNWQQLLREWLPSGYPVETKGRIVFPDGSSSRQVDVVILNPCYPKKLIEGTKQYLAGGVLAAFECKVTLAAADIAEARAKCSEIKEHCLAGGSPYRELHSRISYGLLAHSHSWKSKGSDPVGNIYRSLDSGLGEIEHPREMLDWVCVADLGTWIAAKSIWLHETKPKIYHVHDGKGRREVTEEEFLAGLPKGALPPGWEDMGKPNVSASHFGLSGVSPVGCFIVSLLYKLAWGNRTLRPLVFDMLQSGLIQAGRGNPRSWGLDILPVALIEKMRLRPRNQLWNEWSTTFCSMW